MSATGTRRGGRGQRRVMLALAFRCWLLVSLALGALGTPWWAVAGDAAQASHAATSTLAGMADAHGDPIAQAGHDCHDRGASTTSDDTRPVPQPMPTGHPHGSDCDGALCDCGCVLPPLLIPARIALPAGSPLPAPRLAALPALHAPALNTPFRPPIG
jgi:hypothetical protein